MTPQKNIAGKNSSKLNATKERIRVLVADDHPVVRKGVQFCLSRVEQLLLVGEAADGDEALQRALGLMPDVVLLDISMPGRNGLDVTRVLREQAPTIKVLILTVHHNPELIFRIIQAGAHGYVSKEASPEVLLHAVKCVSSGETFFSPDIVSALLSHLVTNSGTANPLKQLTSRECEVLILLAEGQSNKQMANSLGIGVRTVETHRQHAMRRLGLHSVVELTRFAIASGLIALEGEPWGGGRSVGRPLGSTFSALVGDQRKPIMKEPHRATT